MCVWIAHSVCVSVFGIWSGSHGTVHVLAIHKIYCVLLFFFIHDIVYGPPNSVKCRFLNKFRSYSTIYIFKNYFTTVFLTINFQFSINKRYLNKSLFKKILQILPYKGTLVTQLLVCVWIALTMRFCIWSRTRLHYALMHI